MLNKIDGIREALAVLVALEVAQKELRQLSNLGYRLRTYDQTQLVIKQAIEILNTPIGGR